MATSTKRPGPLRELPLEHFSQESVPVRSNKRPLSPGAPNLFSPAKRRILNQEGIFSPEKSVKSPFSDSGSGRFAPMHFQDLLSGPNSPARKLDFGSPSSAPAAAAALPSSQLFAGFFADPIDTNYTLADSTLHPSPEFPAIGDSISEYFDSPAESSSAPHKLPFPSQRNLHYPGFDVWRASCIEIMPAVIPPAPATKSKDTEDKENLAPRMKPRKSVTSSGEPSALLKGALLSPDRKKKEIERPGRAKSIPATPSLFSPPRDDSITPSTRLIGLELSSGHSLYVDRDELRRRRLALSSEADGDEEDEV